MQFVEHIYLLRAGNTQSSSWQVLHRFSLLHELQHTSRVNTFQAQRHAFTMVELLGWTIYRFFMIYLSDATFCRSNLSFNSEIEGPGLVVTGGDRLVFWRLSVQILAPYRGWTFFTLICCTFCNDCLKGTDNSEIEQKSYSKN